MSFLHLKEVCLVVETVGLAGRTGLLVEWSDGESHESFRVLLTDFCERRRRRRKEVSVGVARVVEGVEPLSHCCVEECTKHS